MIKKISIKILLAFVLVGFLSIGTLIYEGMSFRQLIDTQKQLNDKKQESLLKLKESEAYLTELKFLYSIAPNRLDLILLKQDRQRVELLLKNLNDNSHFLEHDIDKKLEALDTIYQRIYASASKFAQMQAQKIVEKSATPLFENLESALSYNSDLIHNKYNEIEQIRNQIVADKLNHIFYISLFLFISFILFGYYLRKQFTKPIDDLTHLLKKAAEGDHVDHVPYLERQDEIGSIANATRTLKEYQNKNKKLTYELNQFNLSLEKNILERTKKLEEAKKEAESANIAKSDSPSIPFIGVRIS